MHLIIANQIADQLSIKDKISFLLVGVAPDAVSPKDLSHFFAGSHREYSRSIDYEQFINKYSSHKHSDFILGYYTHLIADDIWLKGFYLSWLKNRLENDKDLFDRYHKDFRLLNGKLLNYYHFTRCEGRSVGIDDYLRKTKIGEKDLGVIQEYQNYQIQTGIIIPNFKERLIGARYYNGLIGLRFYAKMGWNGIYFQLRNELLNLIN